MTTELQAVRDYLLTFPGLATGALVLINSVDAQPISYSIVPTPGPLWAKKWVSGGGERVFPFAIQMMASTDAYDQIENDGFFDTLATWLESQTRAKVFPILATGKTVSKIEATSLPYLFLQGESDTGIYQAEYKLTYNQAAP